MDAHHFLIGNRLNPERIGVAQILFTGKRDLVEILFGPDLRQSDLPVFLSVVTVSCRQALHLLIDQRQLFTVWSHALLSSFA